MEFSVVIPFYDNKNMLQISLQNLLRCFPDVEYEVIVVNDNPDVIFESSFMNRRNIHFVHNPENLGASGAYNVGVESAKGRYVIFQDSDVIPTPGCFDALFSTQKRLENYGAIGGKILDLATGKLQYFGLAFYEIDVIKPFQFGPPDNPFTKDDKRFQAVPSGAMLVEKETFQCYNGFDKRMYNAYPDLDLSCRLNLEGLETWVSANFVVFHRGMVSGPIRYSSHSDAKALFFRKWGNYLTNDGLEIFDYSTSLFKKQKKCEKRYLAINLSNSLYYKDYLKRIESNLETSIIQTYTFSVRNNRSSTIYLEDFLTWDLCKMNIGMIYFVDNITSVVSNYHWFVNRRNNEDIIADRNGNIVLAKEFGIFTLSEG